MSLLCVFCCSMWLRLRLEFPFYVLNHAIANTELHIENRCECCSIQDDYSEVMQGARDIKLERYDIYHHTHITTEYIDNSMLM